jgi:hypothetical protein
MCCFSRHVEKVWSTRIFARPLGGDRQLLVYGMSLELGEDVAMILPIPVPPGTPEDGVRFVDMSARPRFFDDLSALFPTVPEHDAERDGDVLRSAPQPATLIVHDVGDFEATFVPKPSDFDRLDARFRLPGEVWEALPRYGDWGFCVFKLKAVSGKRSSGLFGLFKNRKASPRTVHPMAFEFPRRDPNALFFPTVHVHDGEVHPTAEFDHELFCQTPPAWEPLMEWRRSASRADQLPPVVQAWVDPSAWVYQRVLAGELPNRDTYLVESRLRARTAVSDAFRVRMRAAWEHMIDDGKTELTARVKRWMRVSEAERTRIRDAMTAQLSQVFADKGEAWSLGRFAHDGAYQTFAASNDRIEPQEVDVAFDGAPSEDVRAQVQEVVQSAIDRATR